MSLSHNAATAGESPTTKLRPAILAGRPSGWHHGRSLPPVWMPLRAHGHLIQRSTGAHGPLAGHGVLRPDSRRQGGSVHKLRHWPAQCPCLEFDVPSDLLLCNGEGLSCPRLPISQNIQLTLLIGKMPSVANGLRIRFRTRPSP